MSYTKSWTVVDADVSVIQGFTHENHNAQTLDVEKSSIRRTTT